MFLCLSSIGCHHGDHQEGDQGHLRPQLMTLHPERERERERERKGREGGRERERESKKVEREGEREGESRTVERERVER